MDIYSFLMMMVVLIICITIHEFAHAYAADRAGDKTPRSLGRISLNPLDHLDPMGTIMMAISSLAGFGIGWGKPVQINPGNFRNPRRDDLIVSLWGPLSNILTAAVTGISLRYFARSMPDTVFLFIGLITQISIGLAVFNLIPIAPLDGSHILSALLPYEQAKRYDAAMRQYGTFIFLGLIMLGNTILPAVLGPPREFLWHLFVGR